MTFPPYLDLSNLKALFPADFSEETLARAQTLFLGKLSLAAHSFYGGKMMTLPKAGIYGPGWFGVWYTPGVSAVSKAIRDNNQRSYNLSNRSNLVAIVSDSTRVLGDGDVTPSGGLGVMEGKAFLMNYLGGIDATSLCINSHLEEDSHRHDFDFRAMGEHDHSADKIVEFVRMVTPSFGAVNLEDISLPNCFHVLDSLQDCGIPVWHDDAQGTASVTLAGMINALKLADKEIRSVRAVFLGAGASNSTIIRLLQAEGLKPENIAAFDIKGGLHSGRDDLQRDGRYYRQWEICQKTNPQKWDDIREACKGADILCALSAPGPGVVKPEWISSMAERAIVFTCANPVPEIYPFEAKAAGAYIVATGRSDFPNQVNNSLCFPGLLKGCLLVQARQVTDRMAIAAARSLAASQQLRGLDPDHIMPSMDDVEVFPKEAADVAVQAMLDGVSRQILSPEDVFQQADRDIKRNREMVQLLMEQEKIPTPPQEMIDDAVRETVREIQGKE